MLRAPRTALALVLLCAAGAIGVLRPWAQGPGRSAAAALAPDGADRPTAPAPDATLTRLDSPGERSGTAVSAARELARTAAGGAAAAALERFDVRVIDAPSGAPLGGVEVRLGSAATGEALSRTTDADGRARLEAPFAVGDVRAVAPRHVDVSRPGVPAGEELVLALDPSASLTGRVDVVGRADLDGAAVHLWQRADARGRGRAERVAELDASGSFRFDDLSPGYVSLALRSEDAPLVLEPGVRVEAGVEAYIVLRVPERLRLAGRVLTLDGAAPVEGVSVRARVEVQGASDAVEALGAAHAVTDEDGRFVLEGLSPGPHDIDLEAPWGARARREALVSSRSAGRVVELRLPGPAVLEGVVRDGAGRPVAGAAVGLAISDGARRVDWSALGAAESAFSGLARVVSGTDGSFRFPAVPARVRLALVAVAAGSVGGSDVPPIAEGEVRVGVELRVAGLVPVQGRVVDEAGAPVGDARVRLEVRVSRAALRAGETRTAADGTFLLEGVPAASPRLRVAAEGFRDGRVRVALDGGRALPALVVLERSLVVTGVVVDPEGRAVPGAGVSATRRWTDDDGESRRDREGARADAFGRFRVDDLRPGRWSFQASAAGYERPAESGDGEALVALDVRADAARPPELRLVLVPVPEPPRGSLRGAIVARGSERPVLGLEFDGARDGSAILEEERFRLVGVQAGRLRITVRAPGYETARFPAIDLAPGADVDLGRLELRAATRLTVRVEDVNGERLRGATVRLERLPSKEAGRGGLPRRIELERLRTRDGATFIKAAAPRAKWRLRVVHPEAGQEVLELEVTGARLSRTVRLPGTAR